MSPNRIAMARAAMFMLFSIVFVLFGIHMPAARGEWNEWGRWGRCYPNCGPGSQRRIRTCLQHRNCIGHRIESRRCNRGDCPVWSEWSDWTNCSASCDLGTETRQRVCQSEVPCHGSSSQFRHCNLGPCPEWTAWTWWSPCSTSCDIGKQTRYRDCISRTSQTCTGKDSQSQACKIQDCQDISWNAWSACSKTCGGGHRQRTRKCPVGESICDGTVTEVQICSVQACEVMNEDVSWSAWSACSETCGDGQRRRTRQCMVGESSCEGTKTEVENCYLQTCQDVLWSIWSACSQTCGDGQRRRSRQCMVGESSCEGTKTEVENCFLQNCEDVLWSSWSACSETCGDGQRRRTRQCMVGESNCEGTKTEVENCNLQTCEDVLWSTWSVCSQTCGDGQRQRTRQCMVGESSCEGTKTEVEKCSLQTCEDVLWSAWSACSKTCGDAQRQRTRQCMVGESSCEGTKTEVENCFLQTCRDFRQLSTFSWIGPDIDLSWSFWSACSQSCGGGQRRRTRQCIIGISNCNGTEIEVENCPLLTCGVWAAWGSWSECSTTCEAGSMTRARLCEGAISCSPGNRTETKNCNMRECPEPMFYSYGSLVRNREYLDNTEDTVVLMRPKIPMSAWILNISYWARDNSTTYLQAWHRVHGRGDTYEKKGEFQLPFSRNGLMIVEPAKMYIGQDDYIGLHFVEGGTIPYSGWKCNDQPVLVAIAPTGHRIRRQVVFSTIADQQTPCRDYSIQVSLETTGDPITGVWREWSEWGACSVSCAYGTSQRRRTCLTPRCDGSDTEMRACNPAPCPAAGTLVFGPTVINREYVSDTPGDVILPNVSEPIPTAAELSRVWYYARDVANTTYFQIWRPVSDNATVRYQLVSTSQLRPRQIGVNYQGVFGTNVQKHDVIGLYVGGRPNIPMSAVPCTVGVTLRAKPPTLRDADRVVFDRLVLDDIPCRRYAIQVTMYPKDDA